MPRAITRLLIESPRVRRTQLDAHVTSGGLLVASARFQVVGSWKLEFRVKVRVKDKTS